ncbi:MAG: hypothetical protein NZ889_00815 [Candidatus Pacearchaeota archaeon]|nr:hypothetical protein [Candidatus Pacearchaeota archaeon]
MALKPLEESIKEELKIRKRIYEKEGKVVVTIEKIIVERYPDNKIIFEYKIGDETHTDCIEGKEKSEVYKYIKRIAEELKKNKEINNYTEDVKKDTITFFYE